MKPQGTSLVNLDHYTAMVNAINGATSCAELQALTDAVMATIKAETDAITAQMGDLAPILELLTSPAANPAAIVTWITKYITRVLTPQYQPYITYAAQLAATVTAIEQLVTAINSARLKFPHCSISIPTVP